MQGEMEREMERERATDLERELERESESERKHGLRTSLAGQRCELPDCQRTGQSQLKLRCLPSAATSCWPLSLLSSPTSSRLAGSQPGDVMPVAETAAAGRLHQAILAGQLRAAQSLSLAGVGCCACSLAPDCFELRWSCQPEFPGHWLPLLQPRVAVGSASD
jgi:hypothetical protein